METNPSAIGIILDGNRRWARERGLPTLEGHRAGFEKVKELVSWARARAIHTVYIYAFSTENWNRTPEEVGYLMTLFAEAFSTELIDDLVAHNGRIVFLGDRSRIPHELARHMARAEERTKEGTEGTLAVCLSYGGRAEIVAAAEALRHTDSPVTEEVFAAALWSAGLPDPDLIIRTGGDMRLSNFLLWQAAYAELFFVPEKWPDFSEALLDQLLEEYRARERRRGK